MTAEIKAHRNIFITGSSSGIGREFALALAPGATHLWLTGRDAAELEITAAAVRKINPAAQVECLRADLTNAVERENLLARASGADLDLVVLNAGGGNFNLFADSRWPEEENVIELNITSTVHLSHRLIPKLIQNARRRNGRGAIIFISSHAAFMRIPHFSVYASCKSFVNSFALTLVQEYSAEPLDILLVCPGATRSQFSARAGLPQKMLSSPSDPATVAAVSLSALGRRHFLIVNRFDRILYVMSRWLPVAIFDGIVTRLQKKLLAKAMRMQSHET